MATKSRAGHNTAWVDHVKISESKAKLTTPGLLDVRRYYASDGKIAGDMVFDINSGVEEGEIIVDPLDSLRRKYLAGKRYELLFKPLARGGAVVLEDEYRQAMSAQKRAMAGLETLDATQKRILNPHTYPVGLEKGLHYRRAQLVAAHRGITIS